MIRATLLAAAAAASLAAAAFAQEDGGNLVLEVAGKGEIEIELFDDRAPQHAERLRTLAGQGAYDDVVFHRVIEGFMAQTGDVEFGAAEAFGSGLAGTGGSELPDLPAEFSDVSFDRGVVGMARSADPGSANSQFFIMFEPAPHLDGQYTAVGRVVEGMDVVDSLERGAGPNGAVLENPDLIESARVGG
jgi:peptidylprolyl isomerase